MIGSFNPFVVTSAAAAVATNVINSRSTNAASELVNAVEWLATNS